MIHIKARAWLAALIIVAGATPVPGWSQGAPSSPDVFGAAAQQFQIAPGGLDEALQSWSRISGIRLLVPADVVKGLQSAGLAGSFTPEQALNRLLAGSRLGYRPAGARAVAIHELNAGTSGATELDPVQVQGAFSVPPQAVIGNLPASYAGGQVATGGQVGLLGNRDVMDTPFNQTSYTAQKAQNQQAKTIREVLIDDPSVRSQFPSGGLGVDSVTIRGFGIANGSNISYGGLYGMLSWKSTMAEMAERIEVLKGPSAMLNGMTPNGNVGGSINIVPKRAPDEPLTQFTASYMSDAQFGGHVDFARRFGVDNQFGVRFNGVYRAGETPVQNNTDQRGLGVLGLDFRGERVRLSADLGYQQQYIGGMLAYLGVANGVPLPYAPNARTNQGQPWAYNDVRDLFGTVRAEVDLTERITVYAGFGAHDGRILSLYSFNTILSNFSGGATASVPTAASQYETYLTAQGGIRALVDTGPIGHEFALAASTLSNNEGYASATSGSAFATNIYNPTIIARPNIATPVANKTSTNSWSSLGIADTLSAAEKRIQLTVGARLQQVASTNYNVTTGAQTASYDQNALSPAVALVVKPWQNVSVYGNWIQGLQKGTTVGATYANAGTVFPPYKTTQYEVGVKVDWGRFTTTADVFQISQPSTIVDVASNTLTLNGEQRNQGFELNFFGEPTEGTRLLGGVMLLNPVLAKTQGGTTDGWIAPFVPQVTLNLGGEWDLPFVRGLTLTGRAVYTGAQYIDTTWPRRMLPEWTRFDLGARYAFENPGARDKLLVARLSVENILDNNYWEGGGGATSLNLGMPRTFRLSLTADF